MSLCDQCGASMAPDEKFCGTCGAQRKRDGESSGSIDHAANVVTPSAADDVEIVTEPQAEDFVSGIETWGATGQPAGGTGEMLDESGATSRTDVGAERRPKPK